MKKVSIFTTFTNVDSAYSLIGVVQNQIRMLVSGGYEPTVVVKEGFRPEEAFALPGVTLKFIPHVHTSNYVAELVEDKNFKRDLIFC